MPSLNQYFTGVASKHLSMVDATKGSRQHAIGSKRFAAILGHPGSGKLRFKATFILFREPPESNLVSSGEVTYSDVRYGQPHRRAEYHLYYPSNPVTTNLSEGDFCLIAKRSDDELLIAFAPAGSDDERRLQYLFDTRQETEGWVINDSPKSTELDFASRVILDAIGIEPLDDVSQYANLVHAQFGDAFPTTRDMSDFARSTFGRDIDVAANPDQALEQWMQREELLFRALESTIVQPRIAQGFESVDEFVTYSLSVHNRRKSRVGQALENHLEAVFNVCKVRHQRGITTEGRSRPDFLFPDVKSYRDPSIGSPPLRMLAAKTTCKDRWRQVLAEAKRIPEKHLMTLETAISESQTREMQEQKLQLVVPASIAQTYTSQQQRWLLSLSDFIKLVK
jgi:hypothetical protein